MQWDYIIVGAGSAGCVLANRLSEDRDNRVLLVEAGGTDRSPIQRIPLFGTWLNFWNEETTWRYETRPDSSRHGRKEMWTRGKIIGGSSSINGMIYVRGAREDFDHWASLGNEGWSYAEVLPLFKRLEDHEFAHSGGEQSEYYGKDGLLKVRQMKGAHLLSSVFVDACADLGVPSNPHYNAEHQEGACILSMTTSKRMRCSSSQAFLQPARHRPNLAVMENTLVTKVVIQGKRAMGVRLCEGAGSRETEARGNQVILAGGAINSPQLLLLSGIGPARHLRDRDIAVSHDLPGVGKNLQDHTGVQMMADVNIRSLSHSRIANIGAAWNWLIYGKGPLMSAGYQALAFLKTQAALPRPDVQLHMMPGGIAHTGNSVRMLDRPCITLLPNVSYPKSRGEVSLASNSPYAHPAISPNLLGEEEDARTLMAAARFCRALLQSKSFRPYVVQETVPGTAVHTDQEWIEFVRQTAATSYHHSGTCKMGIDSMAVVDPRLKVHGIDNLRVVDGSVIPTLISGNTNATCMMIAEKGAQLILQDRTTIQR